MHIGNGKTLSPYNDFIFDDETSSIYILDQNKILKSFETLDAVIVDDYINLLMNKNNQQNPYSLKHFFKEHDISYKELAQRVLKTEANIKNEQIQEIIKTGTRPYIPGSSIKGVIRTALLYFHRKENRFTIDNAVQTISDKRNVDIGKEVFGKMEEDIFKYLHVSDTNYLSPDDVKIVKINRYHLKKKSPTVSLVTEVIPEGKQLKFKLQCKAKKDLQYLNPKLSYFYEDQNKSGEKTILQKVNAFSKKLLTHELDVIEKFSVPVIKGVKNILERLYDLAETFEKNKNGAILRLGFGKTFFDNTINHLFTKEDMKKLPLKFDFKEPFPKTRYFTENQNVYDSVLGWVALEL